MSFYSFKLPDLGEGIVVSEIVEWHISVGDHIEEDQHIADVMTDKAVVEVTSPVSGLVDKLACDAGIEIPVGSELIRVKMQSDESILAPSLVDCTLMDSTLVNSTLVNSPLANEFLVEQSPTLPSKVSLNDKENNSPSQLSAHSVINAQQILTSPSVRKRAREQQIDLNLVTGSGVSGRINNTDLEQFIANGAGQVSLLSAQSDMATKEIKINGLRKVIAQKMLKTTQSVPHYSYIEEIDLTALETLRQHLNAQRSNTQQKLTILPFMMKAIDKTVAAFPHCNAHYDEQREILTQHSAVHIGIATMTDLGLMVPVVKNTQALDVWQCAAELTQLTEKTRAGKAKSEQLSGSTITITSLGAIGGIATTPIINAPETTIIGINKMQQRAVVINGKIEVRTMMNLSSSFDHRIVDGYDGAMFIQALKGLLENPGAIFV